MLEFDKKTNSFSMWFSVLYLKMSDSFSDINKPF